MRRNRGRNSYRRMQQELSGDRRKRTHTAVYRRLHHYRHDLGGLVRNI